MNQRRQEGATPLGRPRGTALLTTGLSGALALLAALPAACSSTPPPGGPPPASTTVAPEPAPPNGTGGAAANEPVVESKEHAYWGATVTEGEHPPWIPFEPGPDAQVAYGTFKKENPSIAEVVKKEWKTQRTFRAPAGDLTPALVGLGGERVVTFSREKGEFYVFNLKTGRLELTRPLDGYQKGEPISATYLREIEETDRLAIVRPSGAYLLKLGTTDVQKMPNASKGTNVEPAGPFGLYGIDDLGEEGGRTIYFQWASKDLAATVECQKPTSAWSLSEDGTTLGLLYRDERIVEILDLDERRILGEVETPESPATLAVSPHGNVLVVGGKSLLLFDLERGTVLASDTSFEQPVTRLRFTPQGDLLIVASADGTVRSYALPREIGTLTALPKPQTLRHGKQAVVDVRISPDGRRLTTTGKDREIHVFVR